MEVTLRAQPFESENEADGFEFTSFEEWEEKQAERDWIDYDITFVDGDRVAEVAFEILGPDDTTLGEFFELLDDLAFEDEERVWRALATIAEVGLAWDAHEIRSRWGQLEIIEGDEEDYAREYVERLGYLQQSAFLARYFDYEAFASDLSAEGNTYQFSRDGIEMTVGNLNDF